MRNLGGANRTGLLNNNITVVTPAPPAVQAEASGQEYSQGELRHQVTVTDSAVTVLPQQPR